MEDKKIDSLPKEEEENLEEEKNKILKPTISSEELIHNSKNEDIKEMARKIEQYNYKQGFRTVKGNNEIIVKKEEEKKETKQVYIKPPRKKIKIFPILIIFIFILGLFSVGYLYTNGFFDKKVEDSVANEEEPKIEIAEEKDINYKCSIRDVNEEFNYNSITEIYFYTKDNKLIKKEEENTIQYYNEVPEYLIDECPLIENKYTEYEGYLKQCYMKDNLSVTNKTIIDLEKLEDKELKFIGEYEEIIKIEENLDDDIFIYLENLKSSGFTCEQID